MAINNEKKEELRLIIGISLNDSEMGYLFEHWNAFYETPWLYRNVSDIVKETLLERRQANA